MQIEPRKIFNDNKYKNNYKKNKTNQSSIASKSKIKIKNNQSNLRRVKKYRRRNKCKSARFTDFSKPNTNFYNYNTQTR